MLDSALYCGVVPWHLGDGLGTRGNLKFALALPCLCSKA